MDINSVIKRLNLPQDIVEKLKSKGIKTLYPPQRQALEIGLFRKKNLVLAMPTAGGKTLVAEFYILNEVLKNHTHCLYIVPLKALASEKYEDFKEKYKDLGLKIGIATSDYDLPSNNLSRYEVLVATQEKIDSLLRFRARWLLDRLGLVIIDEIHYLDDPSRGPTLEILIARLRELKPSLRILALSATISNSLEIASWLGAELILSNFRPIPLKEGVYFNQKIRFSDGTIRHINRKEKSD
jgi:helicase